jgi:uncharacterized repeat protein (TIGR02543 family)
MGRKFIIKFILLFIIFFGVTSVFLLSGQKDFNQNYELLYQVEDEHQALTISEHYGITLSSVSKYGIASYEVSTYQQYESLKSQGFVDNSSSSIIQGKFDNLTTQYAIELMRVDLAWTITSGNANVLIAIIDTGIAINHVEFIGRLSPSSYNAKTKQVGLEEVEDDTGHGTNVAGIIGANKDNNIGIAGIVQLSQLLIIKANNPDDPATPENEEESFSDSSIIEAIYYAADHGADVINLSLGGSEMNPLMQNAINYAYDRDAIVIAASGNDGTSEVFYPASYNHVISVGAVDQTSTICDFSNHNAFVDIAAPGDAIKTTGLNDLYPFISGTSFSAPQVSGVVALMRGYLTTYTIDEIVDQLFQTAIDKGAVGRDDYYGYGVVDAYQAVQFQYVTINFDTDGGTIISPIIVQSNQIFTVANPVKTGHTFAEWYTESTFTNLFVIGTDTTNINLTLYAKYIPNTYTITFVTEGTLVNPMLVTYGSTFTLPDSSKEGFVLEGWYLDTEFTQKYTLTQVTSDLMLYAKFEILMHPVNFYVDGTIDSTVLIEHGTTFDLYTPVSEYPFIGWYIDPTFQTVYSPNAVYLPLNLYAKFDDNQYAVVYYDGDLSTILKISYVNYGLSVLPPEDATKTSSLSFDFTFIGWSESALFITEDLLIYPEFDRQYKPDSIHLLPSIDTIVQGEAWEDGTIDAEDPIITYQVRSNLDTDTPGRYLVYYDIYDGDVLLNTKIRVVNVVALQPEIVITLKPDLTTIRVGTPYADDGATSNVGTIVKSGTVDNDKAGVYTITYTVNYMGFSIVKTKYIYVVTASGEYINQTMYYKKEESGWLA